MRDSGQCNASNWILAGFMFLVILGCENKPQLPAGDPDHGGLYLPDGFEALVVADSTGSADIWPSIPMAIFI